MKFIVNGIKEMRNRFKEYRQEKEKQIVEMRKKMALDLVLTIIQNTPVWSGRSVRSVYVSSGPAGGNEPHPDRGDYSLDGHYKGHPEWTPSSQQGMGGEKMRPSAEAVAIASAEGADYSLGQDVRVRSDSYMWELIENARAPSADKAMNSAVVSDLAIAYIRQKYLGIVN